MNKDPIKNILTTILSNLNDLHSLLNTEKALLAKSEFENITDIADQKKKIIMNIEVDDAKFKTLLKSAEKTDIEASVHDIVTKNIPECAHLWIEIENLLKICKDKNAISGIILSNNRRQVQERLAILQGQTNEILTYGATGESITKSTTNSPFSV